MHANTRECESWPHHRTDGRVVLLRGSNLSGRTEYLVRAANGSEQDSHAPRVSAYAGLEVYFGVSALATTVRGEIELHAGRRGLADPMVRLLDLFQLSPLLDRNPFTLSGGEQASLCVAACLARCPRFLAVDCLCEQLDPGRREAVLRTIINTAGTDMEALIADNRITEWPSALQALPAIELPPQDSASQ